MTAPAKPDDSGTKNQVPAPRDAARGRKCATCDNAIKIEGSFPATYECHGGPPTPVLVPVTLRGGGVSRPTQAMAMQPFWSQMTEDAWCAAWIPIPPEHR